MNVPSFFKTPSPRTDASPFAQPRPQAGKRAALLGAVALVALGAAFADGLVLAPQSALALSQTQAQPGIAPASFADVVESVRSAVVSVKVKIVDASADDSEGQMPQMAPGDPLERFFRRFGELHASRGSGRGGEDSLPSPTTSTPSLSLSLSSPRPLPPKRR